MTFSPLIIWAKGPFFFEQLFSVVARTWLEYKSECLFFGPKFQFLAQKSDFCHTTPIFVDDPFLALDMTVNFPPWKRFFDFPFRSYSCFRKKIRLTAQKVFPPPTVGAPSASNSPSALSARALILNRNHGQSFMIVWLQYLADDTLSEAGDFDFYLSSYVRQDITDKVSK